jgi:thiamine biosynthesis lipoprotein
MARRSALLPLVGALCALVATTATCAPSCPSSSSWSPTIGSPPRTSWEGDVFASRWRVVVPTTVATEAMTADLDVALPATLREVEGQLSAWRTDSALSRCQTLGVGVPCPIAPATADVLSTCLDVARASDGAFDISVAPVLALWGFSPMTEGRPLGPPSPADIAAALARVDREAIVVQRGPTATVTRTRADVVLDATAVTDGAAAAALAGLLWRRGLRHFLVDVAGEVVVAGSADGRHDGAPWQVGLSDPLRHLEGGDGPDVAAAIVALRGPPTLTTATATTPAVRALSTSGSTRDLREVGGRTVSHIIDPRVGIPVVGDVIACTVVGPDIVVADALSTACMVLGPMGMATVLPRFEGTSALYAYADGRLEPSAGFPALQR